MSARNIAEQLMKHPDAEVYAYGIRGSLGDRNIEFNGKDFYIISI